MTKWCLLSRYLYAFEMYEKAKEEGRPQTGRGARRKVVVPDSDEDIEDKSQLKLVKMKVLDYDVSGGNSNNATTVNNKSMEFSDLEVLLQCVVLANKVNI